MFVSIAGNLIDYNEAIMLCVGNTKPTHVVDARAGRSTDEKPYLTFAGSAIVKGEE